jgi:uncharacterized membrane protein YsdA (DUF1294 family)/cold shock CspA family protein
MLRAMERQAGQLAVWDDERGFGFVDADDGARLFVHISSIRRIAPRPRIGDRLSFAIGTGRDGRPTAVNVLIAGANPVQFGSRRRGAPYGRSELRDWARVGASLLIVVLALAALVLGRVSLWVPGVYLALGLLSAVSYLADKRAARTGRWRTSESFLLGLDLLGGIAGGLLAQQMLRHKTAKPGFVAATSLVTILHVALLLSGLLGFIRMP